MEKLLFTGVRWEACKAFVDIMENYSYSVDVVTLSNSLIEKRFEELSRGGIRAALSLKKGAFLNYLYNLMLKNKYKIFLSAGFPYILPEKFFRMNTVYINSHPHLLYEHKGSDAIRKSFAAKEKYYGVTVHYMDKNVDSGKIILQRRIKINPTDIDIVYSSLFSFVEPAAILESVSLLKEKGMF